MKRNNKRRLTALGMAAVLLVSVGLSGCSENGNPSDPYDMSYEMDSVLNPLGEFPICKEKQTLKLMMASSTQVVDYETNAYTLAMEEKGNVEFQFDLVPSTDMATKVSLVMSSGTDLPDVLISGLTNAQVTNFANDRVIIPLNKYYENSSYYLKAGVESVKDDIDILKYITLADGYMYTIPRYNESTFNELPSLLWIYKPWLDQLGLDVPETLEEYQAALQAFKDNDVNGNGDATDEIPLIDHKTGNVYQDILSSFIKTSKDGFSLSDDNKIRFSYMTDEYKQCLQYLRDLYSAGLYSEVSFTQDQDSLKTLLASENVRVGSFSWTSTSALPASSVRRTEYEPLWLKNEDTGLTTVRYYRTMPENYYFITAECEHPEVAYRIGDLMCSEEMTIWSRWGQKGVDWTEATEDDECMFSFLGYDAYIVPVLQWGTVQNSHWQNATPGFRTNEITLSTVGSDSSQQAKAIAMERLQNTEGIPPYTNDVGTLIFTSDELERYDKIKTDIDSYVEQERVKFITGENNLEGDWDAYVRQLRNMNVETLITIAQTAYDRMNAE